MPNKRINPKAAIGTGNLGYTYAHLIGNNEAVFLSKSHISCKLQAQVDAVQAYLGSVKVMIVERKTYALIERIQNNMLNLGSMIFSSSTANYYKEVNNLIHVIKHNIDVMNQDLLPTEFQKYGVDELHARWCILTTQIRILETIYVDWLQDFPIPKQKIKEYANMGKLINLLSKWSATKARYHCIGKEVATWESNHA